MDVIPQRGVLRIVPPAQYEADLERQAVEKAEAEDAAQRVEPMTDLAGFVRTRFEMMRNHRNSGGSGWSERLLAAMRAFKGEYPPTKLAEIKKFGGSDVYARIIAMKCRGASALLRDVYLAPDKPWGLQPPDDPDVPPEVMASITQLVEMEAQSLAAAGHTVDTSKIRDRTLQLVSAARQTAKKRASTQAQHAEDRINEMLVEGLFYKALGEFLTDIPLFPFACLKGPVVRIVPSVEWEGGQAIVSQKPRLFWTRVSPFDLWWTPGASSIEDAEVVEKLRLTRADLNDLLDLPGYNHEAIRAVLDEYGRGGISDIWDYTDSERATMESREDPQMNESGMISCLEYHGSVQGRMLKGFGLDEEIDDELRDYYVQVWLIGRHVIKVQLSPSPRKRHPYFITSFEKVPGTPVGNGLPDILDDIAEVCNASLRALVNNLSISSGPQVVVNDDRLAPGEDGEELYPWKRWHVTANEFSGSTSEKPVDFFQPNSNAAELLGVYQKFSDMADELSAIPKYLSGQGAGSGAGRTASGLAMLMGNASKILQTVAANIDRDVLEPLLLQLYDMIMLTDESGLLTGNEQIKVMGVNVAVQRETQRSRQLEFLQITANPLDAQIVGVKGRASILRAVSETIGLGGSPIVPSEDELEKLEKAQQAMMAGAGAEAQGSQAPQGGNTTQEMGPRTSIAGGVG